MERRGVVAGEHEQGGHPYPRIQQPQINHHACLLTWLRLIGRDAIYIYINTYIGVGYKTISVHVYRVRTGCRWPNSSLN